MRRPLSRFCPQVSDHCASTRQVFSCVGSSVCVAEQGTAGREVAGPGGRGQQQAVCPFATTHIRAPRHNRSCPLALCFSFHQGDRPFSLSPGWVSTHCRRRLGPSGCVCVCVCVCVRSAKALSLKPQRNISLLDRQTDRGMGTGRLAGLLLHKWMLALVSFDVCNNPFG